MNYNNYSADDIARLRARLILLGEAPGVGQGLADSLFVNFVEGLNTPRKASRNLLATLWKNDHKDIEKFLQTARLHVVFALKASTVCSDITSLVLGPVTGSKLKIAFRGLRLSPYSSAAGAEIIVNGVYPLQRSR